MTLSKNRKLRKGEDLWEKIKNIPFVDATCSDGKMSIQEIYDSYCNSDMVLFTSTIEGGPVGVTEALSCGCTVVAPYNVGFIDDFGEIITYKCGDFNEVYGILSSFYKKKEKKYDVVKELTETNWCNYHYSTFLNLIDNKNLR